jgi:DNA-binding MarR family transcriptional regulator
MSTESIDFTKDILRYITRLEQQRRRYLDEHLREKKLYGSMYMVLLYLEKEPGASQDELATFLSIDKSGVARICRKLEDLTYIRRERSRNDRRQNKLYLVESGRDLLPIIRSLMHQWRKAVMAGLDERDQKELLRQLGHMMDNAQQGND